MTVAFDAKTATIKSVNGVATLTISNLTVGTGANRALLLLLWFANSNLPAGVTCTWDSGGANQAMTAVPNTTAGTHGGLSSTGVFYGLIAPTSGNKNLVVSWTGNLEAHAAAISFTGVDQTSVAVAFPNGVVNYHDTSTASPITATVTSAVGNIVVASAIQQVSPFGAISGTVLATDDTTGPTDAVSSNYTAGAATVSPTFAFTGPAAWGCIGCDVLASGGGTTAVIINMGVRSESLFLTQDNNVSLTEALRVTRDDNSALSEALLSNQDHNPSLIELLGSIIRHSDNVMELQGATIARADSALMLEALSFWRDDNSFSVESLLNVRSDIVIPLEDDSSTITNALGGVLESLSNVKLDASPQLELTGATVVRVNASIPIEALRIGSRDILVSLEGLGKVKIDQNLQIETIGAIKVDSSFILNMCLMVTQQMESALPIENLSKQQKENLTQDEFVGSVLLRLDSIFPLEYLSTQSSDKISQLESFGGVVVRSDAAVPFESLLVNRIDKSAQLESLRVSKIELRLNPELTAAAQSDSSPPQEFCMLGQQQIDGAAAIEVTSSVRGDYVVRLDSLSTQRVDISPQLEITGVQVVRSDTFVPIEILVGNRTDTQAPLELTGTTHILSDGSIVLENLRVTNKDNLSPQENVRSGRIDIAAQVETLSSTTQNALAAQSESLSGVQGNLQSPLEEAGSLSIVNDNAIPIESLMIARRDIVVPSESLSFLVQNETSSTELLRGVRNDEQGPLEIVSSVSATHSDSTIQLEGLGSLQGDNVDNTENIASLRGNTRDSQESLTSAVMHSNATIEFLGAVRRDVSIPVEWAGTTSIFMHSQMPVEVFALTRFDAGTPAEAISAVVQFNTISPTEFTAAMRLDKKLTAELLHGVRADSDPTAEVFGGILTQYNSFAQLEFLRSTVNDALTPTEFNASVTAIQFDSSGNLEILVSIQSNAGTTLETILEPVTKQIIKALSLVRQLKVVIRMVGPH